MSELAIMKPSLISLVSRLSADCRPFVADLRRRYRKSGMGIFLKAPHEELHESGIRVFLERNKLEH